MPDLSSLDAQFFAPPLRVRKRRSSKKASQASGFPVAIRNLSAAGITGIARPATAGFI